ncbi:MAG: hypothetical protein F7C36_04235 [Desulfurococcales archaeon]|nr:hypothetical protein [Desulfurococcales archaeon]
MAKKALIVLIIGLLLVIAMSPGERPSQRYPLLSTSPENNGPGGTSLFVSDLTRSHHNVVLGGVKDLSSQDNGRILYIILGPDKPFNRTEANIIAEEVKTGKLNLLIADESGNVSVLLNSLGVGGIGEIIFNESRAHQGEGWGYIVGLNCGSDHYYTTKATRLDTVPGGEVLCTYEDGSPAAVLYKVGKGVVLVVGDSSIFANFLYGGYLAGFSPTRTLAQQLVDNVTRNVSTIIIDNTHYIILSSKRANVLNRLTNELATTIASIPGIVEDRSPTVILAILLLATVPWPIIFLYPGETPRTRSDPLEDAEEYLLSVLASRLGIEGEDIDPRELLESIGED